MADKSATEILQNTSKAFVGFETALRVARERLEGAAHAEQLAEAATREEVAARGRVEAAQTEAAALVASAQADAAQIVRQARLEADRARGDVALLESEKATLAGEVAELRAQKDQLAADVARLAGAKVALAPHA